jgi:hypothetical protein
MSVMDEQPPLQPQPPTSPIAALLAKIFGGGGAPPATAGMPQQSTAAVNPLAAGVTAGPVNPAMPAGVGGVPANNLPQGAAGPQTRPMPSPNAMLGSSFAFPNKGARNAAVVSTGIENVASAIHGFKEQKDKDEYQRAKSTWDLYQKAAAVDPQTGQPVDPATMAILAKDPKIVKGWEKLLKMEFPREAGAPDPKTGKPQQGPPIIPKPTADPAAQVKQLQTQRQLEQLRGAPGETGGLTPAEAHQAALVEAGIVPKAQDLRAMNKIDAEIENIKSEKAMHESEAAKLTQELTTIPIENKLKREQIQTQIMEQKKLAADAWKDYNEATKSKTLQEFTVGRTSIKDVLTQQSKALAKMQSQALAARSKLGKAFGTDPEVTPEQDAQQNRVTALNDAYTAYAGMQDDVTSGRVTPTDAMNKARRSAGLDADFNMWGGVPSDAPQTPPKELPDGYAMKNSDGVDVAVKQGNKWVAP